MKVFNMGRVEILKTLPQQLVSHKKNEMLPMKPEQNEKIIVALRHGYETLKPQCVLRCEHIRLNLGT